MKASEAAAQPIPGYISLNYADLFKIQQVRQNIFVFRPVSFSSLAEYLECPGCALDRKRKKRTKEPKHFTHIHQTSLFGKGIPDPRLVGTLLHHVINLLHDTRGPLTDEQRRELLTDPGSLTRFLRRDLLQLLRETEKLKLALFLDELSASEETLRTSLIVPLLRYREELVVSGSTVFAIAERFQFKLASTSKTFIGHRDWGGDVAIVGEFDQIRLRNVAEGTGLTARPTILDFKTGLGKKKRWDKVGEEGIPGSPQELTQPGVAHAMQLAIYWMAFQTRWDVQEHVWLARGGVEDIRMPLQQDLDLIVYNLYDGCQYQLLLTDVQEALRALTNCIFHLNWAMKSGYAWQLPEHDCRKTPLLTEVPEPLIQVGYESISAQECYLLAQEAFRIFQKAVCWKRITSES
ncbi:MAG TPA: PD-(D/E)XK nuclease family protein [Ktedonosporobacter sp.]|nr:PD-(D/E)XK nuclease family protein [Ktedonosporobacter sp.]